MVVLKKCFFNFDFSQFCNKIIPFLILFCFGQLILVCVCIAASWYWRILSSGQRRYTYLLISEMQIIIFYCILFIYLAKALLSEEMWDISHFVELCFILVTAALVYLPTSVNSGLVPTEFQTSRWLLSTS